MRQAVFIRHIVYNIICIWIYLVSLYYSFNIIFFTKLRSCIFIILIFSLWFVCFSFNANFDHFLKHGHIKISWHIITFLLNIIYIGIYLNISTYNNNVLFVLFFKKSTKYKIMFTRILFNSNLLLLLFVIESIQPHFKAINNLILAYLNTW